MITSKKFHTLEFNTYMSYLGINKLKKRFGEDTPTEQGGLVHLTAEEAAQLGEAVPNIDFNERIKTYTEKGYMDRFRASPPSGYEYKGLIRVLEVRRQVSRSVLPIKLVGSRSGEHIKADPMKRVAVNITLETYDYTSQGKQGVGLQLIEIKLLEA